MSLLKKKLGFWKTRTTNEKAFYLLLSAKVLKQPTCDILRSWEKTYVTNFENHFCPRKCLNNLASFLWAYPIFLQYILTRTGTCNIAYWTFPSRLVPCYTSHPNRLIKAHNFTLDSKQHFCYFDKTVSIYFSSSQHKNPILSAGIGCKKLTLHLKKHNTTLIAADRVDACYKLVFQALWKKMLLPICRI